MTVLITQTVRNKGIPQAGGGPVTHTHEYCATWIRCVCRVPLSEKVAKYGRYADDRTIATMANSENFALEVLQRMAEFIRSELGGLRFRAKLRRKKGTLLARNRFHTTT